VYQVSVENTDQFKISYGFRHLIGVLWNWNHYIIYWIAKGVASPEFSGVISNLAEISRKFENSGQPGSTQQGKSSYPVVRLEADQGSVFNSLLYQ